MENKRQAVIWDIDDTLISTAEMAINAQTEALRIIFGHEENSVIEGLRLWDRLLWFYKPNQIEEVIGVIYQEIKSDSLPNSLVSISTKKFWDTFNSRIIATPEVKQVLSRIKASNISLGVVSNGERNFQLRKIEEGELSQFFTSDSIVIAEPGSLLAKPNPHGILECLQRLKVEAKNAWYIGDRITDVLASNLANVRCIKIKKKALEVKEPDSQGRLILEVPYAEVNEVHEILNFVIEDRKLT